MERTNIKIKIGEIEIQYEGNENFLKKDLQELLNYLVNLKAEFRSEKKIVQSDNIHDFKLEITTGNIASKIDCKTGPELIIAACAHLTLVKGIVKIDRQSIINEMKTAPSYYKESYVNNLSSLLKGLIKSNRLNEPSTNVFALTANELKELKVKLA